MRHLSQGSSRLNILELKEWFPRMKNTADNQTLRHQASFLYITYWRDDSHRCHLCTASKPFKFHRKLSSNSIGETTWFGFAYVKVPETRIIIWVRESRVVELTASIALIRVLGEDFVWAHTFHAPSCLNTLGLLTLYLAFLLLGFCKYNTLRVKLQSGAMFHKHRKVCAKDLIAWLAVQSQTKRGYPR